MVKPEYVARLLMPDWKKKVLRLLASAKKQVPADQQFAGLHEMLELVSKGVKL
jgi:hypothetical protein